MVKLDNSRYIGEQISEEDILNWGKGSIVTIQAGTGAGKSHFIKNNLYKIAMRSNRKILFLIHRRNCVEQFHKEVVRDGKDNIIDIRTYQKVEHDIINGLGFDFNQYGYIVADEFHYFMGDANFNHTTDVSLERILKQENATKIFMSATSNYMNGYINNRRKLKTIDYRMDANFGHINRVEFYTSDNTLEQYIENIIDNGEKAIVFIQSATKAYNIYKKYSEYSLFNCGKSDRHYGFVDSDKITDMLVNERFEEQILITTTAMDSGVNIHDENVSNIILDIEDRDVFVQCLGRRRVGKGSNNKGVDIYVKRISNEQLGGRITQTNKRLEKVEYLLQHGTSKYIDMYGRRPDTSGMIYDAKDIYGNLEKRVNDLVKLKAKIDVAVYKEMVRVGYQNYINERVLGREPKQYLMKWKTEQIDGLNDYLESRVGDVMLTVDDRKELIETVNVRRNGRLLKSIDTINKSLEELGVDYRVVRFKTSRTVEGRRRQYASAWKVMRLSD